MHTHRQFEHRGGAARSAIVAVVMIALAGCATGLLPHSDRASTEAPYVGVFTGRFVDGRPVYRFPTIVVLGSRSSVIDDESREGDRNHVGSVWQP